MPEIKRPFTSGRMNKDLDERLVPPGEYRDALNIKISSSENSNVGAIENILGNTPHIYKSLNSSTGSYTSYIPTSEEYDQYGFTLGTAETIGSIKYDKTECIYWFVTGDNMDAVIEYNQTTDVVSPILVDRNGVLNFSKNNLITGINIIDDLLFFTDDLNEPKCVNISRFREASSADQFSEHTEIYGRDFIEADVAVAKKSPITEPGIVMYNTKQLDQNGDIAVIETSTSQNFTTTVDGEVVNKPAGTVVTLTWLSTLPYYNIGDTLVLTAETGDIEEDIEEYSVRVKVNTVPLGNSQSFATCTIESVIDAPPETIIWDVSLAQDPPMFEFKFPRFAYRYIYNNNEISCFSPFSEIAFLPSEFEYNPFKGYNLGMTNNVRNLKITSFSSNTPSDVIKIDILYKDSGNQNVYVVDTLEKDDSGNFPSEYVIKSEIISKVVQSNQILRPWDNVPRLAKSQEIVANRLVYANYLQNFNIKDKNSNNIKPKVSISIEHDPNLQPDTIKKPGKSIKTSRTYQAGVVYKDEYGRETPVFSSETSSVNLPKTQADKNNKIKLTLQSDPPEGFSHFKFFIKENSNEYYNLAMDRFYVESSDNVWLSFPSSERNKVQEDTFLILKKRHDSDLFIDAEARYKVIAIENEAPITLKQQNVSKGKIETGFESSGFPEDEILTLDIPKEDWDDAGAGAEGNNIISLSDLKCKIFNSGTSTNIFYDIENVSLFDTFYRVSLKKPLENVSFTGSHGNSSSGLGIEIFQTQIKNKPEFEGRFFVKIYNDHVLKDNIVNSNSSENYAVEATRSLGNTTRSGTSSKTWKPLRKGWFIDNTGNKHRTYSRKGGLMEDTTPSGETYEIGGTHGRGTRQGSKYIDICYFKWGDKDPKAWEGFWWGFETSHRPEEQDVVKMLESPGQKIRWVDDPDQTIYEIKDFSRVHCVTYKGSKKGKFYSSRMIRWTLKLDKPISWAPEDNITVNESTATTNLEFLTKYNADSTFTSNNPAIWETEPKESVDLDIFYEASENIPISSHGNKAVPSQHELDWFNCYSFGNGVESDRIRDDYNAIRIGKGVKVSATLDEPYQEERRGSGIIFSQIFNSVSGVNRLNQFIQAESITKDLNPANGTIQKLHARDTDLTVLCEDKVLKILAQKDALFNADGSANITSNSNVLGQVIPYIGEYGISKNPESFSYYGFRSYFTDKNRGVVMRLSRDGLTEISSQGMSDYFSDKLASHKSKIIGSYDDNSNCYNISFENDKTVSYKEMVNGWPTFKGFVAESGTSLNNVYYTLKNGIIWSHDNEERNTFYGGTLQESSVKFIFNDMPSKVKNFKTLFYEGSDGWYCPFINTNLQDGQVLDFKEKEGIYYNFISGRNNTWNEINQTGSLDTAEFSTQGIDLLESISGDTVTTKFDLTIKENND
jgi:hypothetical protein